VFFNDACIKLLYNFDNKFSFTIVNQFLIVIYYASTFVRNIRKNYVIKEICKRL